MGLRSAFGVYPEKRRREPSQDSPRRSRSLASPPTSSRERIVYNPPPRYRRSRSTVGAQSHRSEDSSGGWSVASSDLMFCEICLRSYHVKDIGQRVFVTLAHQHTDSGQGTDEDDKSICSTCEDHASQKTKRPVSFCCLRDNVTFEVFSQDPSAFSNY